MPGHIKLVKGAVRVVFIGKSRNRKTETFRSTPTQQNTSYPLLR